MANIYYIDKIKYNNGDIFKLLDSGATHDSNHNLSGTAGNFETTGTIKAGTGIFNELIAVDLSAKNAKISELTAQNATVMGIMDVKGKLMTNSWEAASIANVGGSFYISPTGKDTGTPNVSIVCNSVTSGAGTYTITVSKGNSTGQGNGFGVSSTSSSLWNPGSRVLLTGNVKFGTKNYPLGSLDGLVSTGTNGIVISSNLITSITLTSVVSSALDLIFTEQSTLAANSSLSATSNGSNMQVSLYQNKTANYFYPIGILLSSYGQSDKQQYIDIYSGSIKLGRNANDTANISTGMAEPVLRIGQLDGLPNIVDGSSASDTQPSGWGIYTTNGFFKGKIVANAGRIGNWNIEGGTATYGGAIYTGTFNTTNGVLITPGYTTATNVGGSTGSGDKTWTITAGQNFGLTTNGDLYAQNAIIKGNIQANSGYIGLDETNGFTISSTAIYNPPQKATINSTGYDGIYIGKNGIALGKGLFKVTDTGILEAKNAKLTNLEIYDTGNSKRVSISTSGIVIYGGYSDTYKNALDLKDSAGISFFYISNKVGATQKYTDILISKCCYVRNNNGVWEYGLSNSYHSDPTSWTQITDNNFVFTGSFSPTPSIIDELHLRCNGEEMSRQFLIWGSFSESYENNTYACSVTLPLYSLVYSEEEVYGLHLADGDVIAFELDYSNVSATCFGNLGYQNSYVGNNNFGIGNGINISGGINCFAVGNSHNIDKVSNSVVLNTGNEVSDSDQLVIGKYNLAKKGAAFIIGNGKSDDRSNAFLVDFNGNIMIPAKSALRLDMDEDKSIIYASPYSNAMNTYYSTEGYHAFYCGRTTAQASASLYITNSSILAKKPITSGASTRKLFLLKVATVSANPAVGNWSVNSGAFMTTTEEANYTPIGILSCNINGTNSAYVYLRSFYLDKVNNRWVVYWEYSNRYSAALSGISISSVVLCIENTQGY